MNGMHLALTTLSLSLSHEFMRCVLPSILSRPNMINAAAWIIGQVHTTYAHHGC
jgi:hypothetical protein